MVLMPGWEHESWQGQDGYRCTSLLAAYSDNITRSSWETFCEPPRPFVGENVYPMILLLIED